MRKTALWILCVLLLAGCINKQVDYKEKNKNALQGMQSRPLPRWMYQRPADHYIVGMSRKSKDVDATKLAAKQSAAVAYGRNTESIAIVNSASAQSSNMLSSGNSQFNLVVTASPELLRKKCDQLQLVDECTYYENYIALFSPKTSSIGDEWKQPQIQPKPAWTDQLGLEISKTQVTSRAFGRSSDLQLAWDKAVDAARQEIAQYLEKEVLGGVLSRNDDVQTKVAVETRIKVGQMHVSRSHVETHIANSLLSYLVHVEVVMER
jgi:hypothetical protein